MNNKEIIAQIDAILDKISNNGVTAWSEELSYTADAVLLGDLDGTKYNEWLEDIVKLRDSLEQIQ